MYRLLLHVPVSTVGSVTSHLLSLLAASSARAETSQFVLEPVITYTGEFRLCCAIKGWLKSTVIIILQESPEVPYGFSQRIARE